MRSPATPVAAPSRRRFWLPGSLGLMMAVSLAGCLEPYDATGTGADGVGPDHNGLKGANLSGSNLGGVNLGGSNLAGSNLGGANLGGSNLGGSNLAGSNLGGTNLGGNNLGGSNLAGSNLGGSNLAGSNLAGSNLGGSNLAGSNLGGSNVGGSNLAGNNLGGTNLGGSNLAGSNSGMNIHGLASANGMLYSGEDRWSSKSAQCIVMGIGSTAFARLLGQQSANARISVALGKLPWGFASSKGGPTTLQAWEAVVFGDRTYCVFVMVSPTSTAWSGMAGFIKAVFRWNAPPTQTMEIAGIEASASRDSTVNLGITSYPGMMNAAARFRSGALPATNFVAGELAFASATTNNESVMVDFASWVRDRDGKALLLGNVDPSNVPPYAESLYIALENDDGTVAVVLDDAASRVTNMPGGMLNSVADLNMAYQAWQAGVAAKPVPRRCGGALFLNTWYREPIPAGKCDDGLAWAPGFCIRNANPWSSVAGTTAPMNSYMQLTQSSAPYQRSVIANDRCGKIKTVLSETYVHMWERNYDVPGGTCAPESNAAFCTRKARNCGSFTGTDNCGAVRTVNCGTCGLPSTCGGGGTPNVCGMSSTNVYEAEAPGNTIGGEAAVVACPLACIKFGTSGGNGVNAACSAGGKVIQIGEGSSNAVTINNVNVPRNGTYTMTVSAFSDGSKSFSISANGGSPRTLTFNGPDWGLPLALTTTISLRAGNNSIKFYNGSAEAPNLDKITIVSDASICVPESNESFCARQGAQCGQRTALDNCGASRTVSSCGACPSPLTCGGGGQANACGGPASCSLIVTKNVYDGATWTGTISFKNYGPSASSSYKVEFDLPGGAHCTTEAVPFGATLSPLYGNRTSASHCVYTFPNANALTAGGIRSFTYSADKTTFAAASNVVVSDSFCR